MQFHVARDGQVIGQFDEQTFRNMVFAGEIRPSDHYWMEGFEDWKLVSMFRVARKTEPIVSDTGSKRPPPPRQLARLAANKLTLAFGLVVVALAVLAWLLVLR